MLIYHSTMRPLQPSGLLAFLLSRILTTTMAFYSGFYSVTLCAPAGDCFPGTPSPSEPITTPIKTPITPPSPPPATVPATILSQLHILCQVSKFLLSYFQAMSKTTTTAHGPRPQQSPPLLTPLPQPSPLPPTPPPCHTYTSFFLPLPMTNGSPVCLIATTMYSPSTTYTGIMTIITSAPCRSPDSQSAPPLSPSHP